MTTLFSESYRTFLKPVHIQTIAQFFSGPVKEHPYIGRREIAISAYVISLETINLTENKNIALDIG